MPKKDGRQALTEIKGTPDLHTIPVVVWTTSGLEEDWIQTVDTGADAYATKPIGYTALVRTVQGIGGPKGIPAPIVKKLQDVLKEAMNDPEHMDKMDKAGLAVKIMIGEEYENYFMDFQKRAKELMEAVR